MTPNNEVPCRVNISPALSIETIDQTRPLDGELRNGCCLKSVCNDVALFQSKERVVHYDESFST